MKILLEYDENTGILVDKSGVQIAVFVGITPFVSEQFCIEDLTRLKMAGFTAEEIIAMEYSRE